MKILYGLLCLLLVSPVVAEAGISLGGTRLVFDGSKKETSITVNNSDKRAWLIQSWIDSMDNTATEVPFLVTPPLFRLGQEEGNLLRIVRTTDNLPADRESMFWLNVKSIPSSERPEEGKNMLRLAIKTRIKFIYRPPALKGTPEMQAGRLTWSTDNRQIRVFNPTPFYMNFGKLTAGNRDITPSTVWFSWVAPGATLTLPRPAGMQGNSVTWTIINDFGGTGKTFHATLQAVRGE